MEAQHELLMITLSRLGRICQKAGLISRTRDAVGRSSWHFSVRPFIGHGLTTALSTDSPPVGNAILFSFSVHVEKDDDSRRCKERTIEDEAITLM